MQTTQTEPLNIIDALKHASDWLKKKGLPTARLDAELLLGHLLQLPRLELYLLWDKPLRETQKDEFRELLKRRAQHEPLAYITGTKEFYGLEFQVTPDVLIPRPDTEILVEQALRLAKQIIEPEPDNPLRIADIGTGSGCIAIALAHNLPHAQIEAVDISPQALDVARRNAQRHAVNNRIRFHQGSLLEPLNTTFDLIVSNPPYIALTEQPTLMTDVVDFEPHQALFSGPDGLDTYKKLIPQSIDKLKPGGHLALEIGSAQAQAVEQIIHSTHAFHKPEKHLDYQQHIRVLTARRKETANA